MFCEWVQDDDGSNLWETNCGNGFCVDEGTPEENGMKFCCFCGKPLKEVQYENGI